MFALALAASSLARAKTGAAAPASTAVLSYSARISIWAIQDHPVLIRPRGYGSPYGLESPAYGFRYAPAPYHSYRPYRPRVVAPKPIRPPVSEGLPRPWTNRWYAYCSEKYASFDPRSGSFVTYGGRRRLCR
jgi:hypothetical protein